MSTTIVLATVAGLSRRISKAGKPYWLVLADIMLDGQPTRTPIVIGASPAQLAKGVTESELGALGLDIETAITAPEKAVGAEISVRWEDPTDVNPSGSWRIVTAQSVPEDAFRAALAAQTAKPAAKPGVPVRR